MEQEPKVESEVTGTEPVEMGEATASEAPMVMEEAAVDETPVGEQSL